MLDSILTRKRQQRNRVTLENKRLLQFCTQQQSIYLEREDGMKSFPTKLLLLHLALSQSSYAFGKELLIRLELSQKALEGIRSLILVHSQKCKDR
jgi:hypothetical protein